MRLFGGNTPFIEELYEHDLADPGTDFVTQAILAHRSGAAAPRLMIT